MGASGITVRRWRRYGHDRLYVEQPDGVKVGWWDLAADEGHPESPEHTDTLTAAVAGWTTRQELAEAGTKPNVEEADLPEADAQPVPVAEPVAVEPEESWMDLAQNLPGEAARGEALRLRAQAPVKTTLARVLGVKTDERAWRIGADGEEMVAARIDKAIKQDPRWRVLHAVPVGVRGSDIDHLLIGPGGVFTLNAKHHPEAKIWVGGNTFLVNGRTMPYIRNARFEAERASTLLTAACGFPVRTRGVIVVVGAYISDITIKGQPDDVWVTWRRNVPKWMRGLGPVLSNQAVEAIFEQARRSTSWR